MAEPDKTKKNRTALFVIDIQKALASDPEREIPHAERVKSATADILQSTSQFVHQAPEDSHDIIVYVQHEETPDRGPLQKGTAGWELVFEPEEKHLTSGRQMLVSKNTRDAFESNPTLASDLKARGISGIVAVGIQSECCVQSTCLGALSAGFKVSLVRGAHSTYDAGDETALDIERKVENRIMMNGGRVLDLPGVLRFWGQYAVGGMSVEDAFECDV